ncbi:MAG: sensor histidine kinase, partial [Chloroflexota bacterium]
MAISLARGLPLRLRLALGYALLLVAIVTGVGAYLLVSFQTVLVASVDETLGLRAAHFERAVTAVANTREEPTSEQVSAVLAALAPEEEFAAPGLYVVVLGPLGQTLATSPNLPGGSLPVPTDAVQASLQGTETYTTVDGGKTRVLVRPVTVGGRPRGVLLLGESLQPLTATVQRMAGVLAMAAGVGAFVAILGGWFLTTQAIGPILAVTRVARRIASTGQFEQRLAVPPRRDELGELTVTFNDMLARLARTFQRQKEFLADASHELRSPLMVIRGNLDLLRMDLSPSERQESVREATEEVDRMAALVSDLLFLSEVDAPETVQHAPIALKEVVADVWQRAVDLDGGVHRMELGPNDTANVRGDRGRLQQMLWNLVENALRYTPDGGSVRLALRRQGRVAEITVMDSGIGIPAEHLGRIFERFYRVDRARSRNQGGTGLGLAIVKQVVEAHGGQVRVRSEPGQ